MKKILIALAVLSLTACIPNPFAADELFYSNSFESMEDLDEWGFSEQYLADDPAPGGGEKAVKITGGCIRPTAYIDFPSDCNGYYKLNFWAKVIEENQSGMVALSARKGSEIFSSDEVQVEKHSWTHHEGDKVLFCPKGYSLRLEVHIGGIIPASMMLDLVEIKKTG